ncbi:MAG TPA: hypothetical protein VLL75_16200 [Vicinamibacteria bacterium]|nr:hypothetical protein [Vicinamibacteria bacterium]
MRRVTVLLALLGASVPACGPAARELTRGSAGTAGSRALAQALADRFGPIDREPGFDALRPKLAAASLVPSRVFEDESAWRTRGDGWRAVELDGYVSGGVYRIGARAEALPARVPGQYRGRVQLRTLEGGRFEWSVTEELAVGPTRPSDLARALEALFRSAEHASEASVRAAIASTLPRASARLGLLIRLETLVHSRGSDGATSVCLAVRLTPAGIRGFAPRYAAFLEKYATPIRTSLTVADAEGGTWWTLTAADNRWTLRLRLREGSLVPLEGPPDRRLPGRLRATADFATRMGRFEIGAQRIVSELALTRTSAEKGLSARFLKEPDWRLPFLVETVLHSPLRYPFEAPGSEMAWAAQETPGGTLLTGLYRARVRETWILRWLGGMMGNAVNEFRRGAELEADQYHRECLLALRDDLAALEGVP